MIHTARDQLTRFALLDLLCRNRKNRKHLSHDLYNHVRHPCGRRHFDICLQSPEEVLYLIKDASECILAFGNGLCSLRETSPTADDAKELKLTERRTLIPVKITPAGGNPCTTQSISDRVRIDLSHSETYQTNTRTNGSRKTVEYIDRRIEPFGQFVVGTTGVIEAGDLFSKQSEDSIGRIAGFEFGKQWMGTEVFVGLPLVGL